MSVEGTYQDGSTSLTGPLGSIDARVREETPWEAPSGSAEACVLGVPVGMPVGIGASAATRTADHVGFFAGHGWDVITFKTVRSRPWPEHPGPKWVYASEPATSPAAPTSEGPPVVHPVRGEDGGRISAANSFGVPSPEPLVWQRELAAAHELLGEAQLLIVSVQGSPEVAATAGELVEDYVRVARSAEEAGATAIELNLSCPNMLLSSQDEVSPPLCEDFRLVASIVSAVRQALDGGAKLVAKLTYMPRPQLRELLTEIGPDLDAVAGINTLPVRVLDAEGRPFFQGRSEGGRLVVREVAGLSGGALRHHALDFSRSVAAVREEMGLELELLAMGGVADAEDARELLKAGADAVQLVTAAVRRPELARELRAELGYAAARV
jgi:dihydroorotate dehydrogenase